MSPGPWGGGKGGASGSGAGVGRALPPAGRQHRAAPAAAMRRTVLSRAELGACLALVLYLLWVLTRAGLAFCDRLVAARVPVPGLRRDWLGWNDLSDHQWREFRASAPLLSAVMAAFVAASRAVRAAAPRRRAAFYAAAGAAFVCALHGACALYVLALAAAGFYLARAAARWPHGLPLVWAWHCATFLAVRATDGLPFSLLGPRLAPLDAHRGMLRWHIHYNLVVLRMLSFAADASWAARRVPGRARALPPDAPPAARQDLRARAELWQPPEAYACPATYLAYLLYPPLYIAGPTVTFNAFASQLAAPSDRATPAAAARYAARAAACWACLELLTHRLWFAAAARGRLWERLAEAEGRPLSPLDMCLVPWWVMIIFWLKFTVIWRFFRLWALADGVEAPENMTRCICNNYDILGFWRNWHASYNQWVVRYLYIPLGGAAWRLLNVWAVFTFVALWHDLEPRLLGWAWLMALLFAPEAAARWLGSRPWFIRDKGGRAFRYAQGLAAAVNILFLISVNMVGFVLGLDGIRPFLEQVLGQPRFLPNVLAALFAGAQLMFALRDWEASAREAADVLHSKC